MEVGATERPHFIPPRKRQSGRKIGGITSHGDHIMTVQGQISNDPPSPNYQETKTNASSKYTSIADRPKLELPTILDDEIYTVNSNIITESEDFKSLHNLSTANSREIIDLSPIFENISESTEMIKMDPMGNFRSQSDLLDNNTAYSLSNTQSDNSLEMCSFKKSKKRVNIQTDFDYSESLEHVSLKPDSEISDSLDRSLSCSTDGYLTMTGTIKRGKKKGQNIDVQLNISVEQLEILEATIVAKELAKSKNICICNLKSGLHVFFWSLICLPFVTLISGIYSFYMGTLTWYNVFTYFSEEKSYLHKLLVTPILVILYPFAIVLCTLGLGLYAGFVQLSIYGSSWCKEVADIEKGFYGWLCSFLKISDCSPYEVVILTDLRNVKAHGTAQPSIDELSI